MKDDEWEKNGSKKSRGKKEEGGYSIQWRGRKEM